MDARRFINIRMEASMSNSPEKPRPFAKRLIVSLQVGGAFFAVANIICVAILAYAYLKVQYQPKTIEVKGSAKKAITSDIVTWRGTITTRDEDLTIAYDKLQADAQRVFAFLKQAGIAENEVTFSSITTDKIYRREVVPTSQRVSGDGGSPAVIQTSRVESYILSQDVSIESRDIQRVPEVSRSVTTLIKEGVEVSSDSPRYLYSKLSELKIDMLAEATKDATQRANQIVTSANGKLGKLVEARMGVMQINPKGVNDVSSGGNNDTTSLEKEIQAVVGVQFEVE
jgi:hypothetical protein